ncbi:Hint domain-containing protein [Azospirillum doebereinerae]|uniref:Hint domain-containing protein n=1 Tax=Azospirillum doebereinerae TaxID=92933 RepID=UPI001EE5C801|nr:Hint domain-containing protein [Azospirillum doebereinerae]MCG5244033.1 Hint domain-containing protein [Azospirillum doebereinerae]
MQVSLNQSQNDHLAQVLDALKTDGAPPAGDPLHTAFLQDNAERSGLTPARYPGLFKAIGSGGAATSRATESSGVTDGQYVEFISSLQSNRAVTARAVLSRIRPVAQAIVWLNVVNENGGTRTSLASGVAVSFATQTIFVETNPKTALPALPTGTMTGIISFAITYQDGTVEVSSTAAPWASQASRDPIVTDPAIRSDRKTGDLNDIVIGLARGYDNNQGTRNKTDIDYWYWQNMHDLGTNPLLLPLSGSMKFDYKLAPLDSYPPFLEFYLAHKEGGISELTGGDNSRYLPHFRIDDADPEGRTLTFLLRASYNDAGNAIEFPSKNWAADTQAFFSARVTVTFEDYERHGSGWSSIVSSRSPDTDPKDGVAFIKPIVYVWHCLVAGTQITLADGTTKAVEDFTSEDVVVSGDGTRPVQATLAQPHSGPITVLEFADGATLAGSATHPVVTPAGTVQAGALAVGDTVLTRDGTTTVTATRQETQTNGGLFNLWLVPEGAGPTTMIANGIVVGDYQIQVQLLRDAAQDDRAVRAKLPESLHVDFDSWVADRVASA